MTRRSLIEEGLDFRIQAFPFGSAINVSESFRAKIWQEIVLPPGHGGLDQMKTCPKCGIGYSDDLSFCLEDGTMLPAMSDFGSGPSAEFLTIANQPRISNPNTVPSSSNAVTPPPKQYKMSLFDPASRMGCIVTFGQVSAILLLVLGLGAAGIYVALRGRTEMARLEPGKPSQSNTTSAPPFNSNASANYSANKMAPIATPSTSTKEPKTISGGVVNGKAISLPQPPYPPAARAVRASGTVTVQVLIDVDGHVLSANAISGHPLLRSAAVAAARTAIFTPMILGGENVKVSGIITYNFVP